MATVALNCIVKNEEKTLPRMLASMQGQVDEIVLMDTGSTDCTCELARQTVFGKLAVKHGTFKNFSQARNEALMFCRGLTKCDYILFCDADMELVVVDPDWKSKLTENAYYVEQRDSTLSYYNVRLIKTHLDAHYAGVTHEVLHTATPPERFHGIYFKDHADGGCRPEKTERDIRLLTQDLEQHPDCTRSLFYRASALLDAGRWDEALQDLDRRISLPGWSEETWYAEYRKALCFLGKKDIANFLQQCWVAYEKAPHRAEPMALLAQWFRERGQNEPAYAIAQIAAQIPYPEEDRLFVSAGAHTWAPKHEMAITGYYCKSVGKQENGRQCCFDLSVDRTVPESVRSIQRQNAHYYARSAEELLGGELAPIPFEAPDGYRPTNPSCYIGKQGTLQCNVRAVNYTIRPDGSYDVRDPEGIVRTQNFMVRLSPPRDSKQYTQVPLGEFRREVLPGSQIQGLEDVRPFYYQGHLRALCTVTDVAPANMRQMAVLDYSSGACTLQQYNNHLHQKNWIPIVDGNDLYFVYSVDPLVVLKYNPATGQAEPFRECIMVQALDHLRGGSQAIPFGEGWLCLTHEVAQFTRRSYLHRFVRFSEDFETVEFTEPFYFKEPRSIEFAAGLCEFGGKLVASFGFQDNEAWLCRIDPWKVLAALN